MIDLNSASAKQLIVLRELCLIYINDPLSSNLNIDKWEVNRIMRAVSEELSYRESLGVYD